MRLVFSALAALVSRRMLETLYHAIAFRDADAAVAAIPTEELAKLATQLEPILYEIAVQGATIARTATRARLAEFVVRLGTADGLPVEELATWAAQHSAAMVRDVTSETRFAVRRIIEQGIHRGAVPRDTAQLVAQVVGLTNRQAQAVARYADALRAAGSPITDGLVTRYGAQLLRHRSRMIARHETIQAANAGRREQWLQEMRQGLIAHERWEREWVAIVPSDGRTCPYCEEQDGQRAPIEGTYPDGSGGPPGHVICRCTEKLVRIAA